MILTAAILLPLLGCLVLALWSSMSAREARVVAGVFASGPLAMLAIVWFRFDPAGPAFQEVVDLPWIPALGAGFRFGVDGISLAVSLMSAVLFAVAAVYPVNHRGKARQYLAWMLFLEAASLGLFLTLDLLVFYVCFDLSLVGMYFLIAIWGHEDRRAAAIKFIIYTLVGSLVMLLGILSLVLASDPLSFDMRVLIAQQPLAGSGGRAGLTLLAILIGLAIKTPVVPVHTWLPSAHVEAPAPVSAILAGVLLKMGTYGMIRLAFSMMHESFAEYANWIAIAAVVSIVYGALVALGQRHIKARIAYTSITHMGYTVLGIAVASSLLGGSETARTLALTGATLEMVAHGLITGALFLIAGSIWQRTHSFEMNDLKGIAARAPRLTVFAVVASFASLGLPGLAGFVAEFQIFAGALASQPALAATAMVGVIVTAALFLELLQQVFFGEPSQAVSEMGDLGRIETLCLALLLGLTLAIGVLPAPLVDVIEQASASLARMR